MAYFGSQRGRQQGQETLLLRREKLANIFLTICSALIIRYAIINYYYYSFCKPTKLYVCKNVVSNYIQFLTFLEILLLLKSINFKTLNIS
jgi:hypothetical protein